MSIFHPFRHFDAIHPMPKKVPKLWLVVYEVPPTRAIWTVRLKGDSEKAVRLQFERDYPHCYFRHISQILTKGKK